MQTKLTLLSNLILLVDYDYKVMYPGYPATGPNYASGGEPEEPMEYEITVTSAKDEQGGHEVPGWMLQRIELHLYENDELYDAIREDYRSQE